MGLECPQGLQGVRVCRISVGVACGGFWCGAWDGIGEGSERLALRLLLAGWLRALAACSAASLLQAAEHRALAREPSERAAATPIASFASRARYPSTSSEISRRRRRMHARDALKHNSWWAQCVSDVTSASATAAATQQNHQQPFYSDTAKLSHIFCFARPRKCKEERRKCGGSSCFCCCWPWWRCSPRRRPAPDCRTSTGTQQTQCEYRNCGATQAPLRLPAVGPAPPAKTILRRNPLNLSTNR